MSEPIKDWNYGEKEFSDKIEQLVTEKMVTMSDNAIKRAQNKRAMMEAYHRIKVSGRFESTGEKKFGF